ncbi:MAG: helix-turn-helix domain-containing protein [Niastella sp.]|nr:helix-turn-helix domain-containing protein [Niastella sp.]
MERYFESNYKKIGMLPVSKENQDVVNAPQYKPYIKIIYAPAGYSLTVDFKHYTTKKSSLFFVHPNQYMQLEQAGKDPGYFIWYNRDFYCVQIHDEEVACDGLLFNNIYEMPMTELPKDDDQFTKLAMQQIIEELASQESSREEMVRTYLKQIIIRTTRTWKKQQLGELNAAPAQDMEFFRTFSRLVEIHFREKHSVTDYADLLALAPKTLSKKFNRLNLTQPNDIIKDRILLEAKRLLVYSTLSIKEIAYNLGYDDPAYFNRLFTNKTGAPPATFRKQFVQTEEV